MMQREVPATGSVKQQAASNTAPQRPEFVTKIRAAKAHEPRRKRKIDARWQSSSRKGSGRCPQRSIAARTWAKIEKCVGDETKTASDWYRLGSASFLIPATYTAPSSARG